MKNPLRKRIFRELKTEYTKYIVIFAFMIVTIGFISGDMVAADSMLYSYEEGLTEKNVEYGHFKLKREANKELIEEIEKSDVNIYKDFYIERNYTGNDKKEKTVRIYTNREKFNIPCLMEGKLPSKSGEIALDRMYCKNNNIKVGDRLTIEGKDYAVSGFVALPDYSALFEKNTDMMFDAINFTVALLVEDDFNSLGNDRLNYNYAWDYKGRIPVDDIEEKEWADNLTEDIVEAINKKEGGSDVAKMLGITTTDTEMEDITPRCVNNAIIFTKDDIGSDRNSMIAFLVILIVIMAFIFAVTISHTIAKEATVIGTLRASGYTRGELYRQYISMPVLVTVIAAIVGNILGYTCFKDMMSYAYYNSYSLPTFITRFNISAFVFTTMIPLFLMFVITSIVLVNKLRLSPLKFIRRDLSKNINKKAMRLPTNINFLTRFRLRIILQNKSSYITMFFGIFVSTALLLFGLMLSPLLNQVAEISIKNMPSNYQYFIKEDEDTKNKSAEKFAMTSLKSYAYGYNQEAVTVYGINENSQYIKDTLYDRGVVISSGYSEKYGIKEGDKIILKEQFDNKMYEFDVKGIRQEATTCTVYMSHKYYEDVFGVDEEYYNGYFSNEELTDLKADNIAATITEKDMRKMVDQMEHSMGAIFGLFKVFAILLFAMMVYLLTKTVIDKNQTSISMTKILGYKDSEVGKLYLLATSWVVLFSVIVSLILVTQILKGVFVLFMKTYTGWIPFGISPDIYVTVFIMTMIIYMIVAFLRFIMIKKIPMDQALKNVE